MVENYVVINKTFTWNINISLGKIEGQEELSGLLVSFMVGQAVERLRVSMCRQPLGNTARDLGVLVPANTLIVSLD